MNVFMKKCASGTQRYFKEYFKRINKNRPDAEKVKFVLLPEDMEAIMDVFVNTFTELLKANGRVKIPRIGTFTVTDYKEKTIRNPNTGLPCTVPPHRRVKFRASEEVLTSIGQPFDSFGKEAEDISDLDDEEVES